MLKEKQTTLYKTVFPENTNHYDTLFGGEALKWMDEVAFLTATRYSRQKYVTVSLDKTDFKKPIPAGTIAEIKGTVLTQGKTSLRVQVDIVIEEMYEFKKHAAITGYFTLVAIDGNKKPVQII